MRYAICLLKSGEIVEGHVVKQDDKTITFRGSKNHVDEDKADLLEIANASLSDSGDLLDQTEFVVEKADVVNRVLSMGDQPAIKPIYIEDDDASMGKGFYNENSGRRLLKVRGDIRPFAGCVVEVVTAEVFGNAPIATVRVIKDGRYFEGITYKVDEELEDFTSPKTA